MKNIERACSSEIGGLLLIYFLSQATSPYEEQPAELKKFIMEMNKHLNICEECQKGYDSLRYFFSREEVDFLDKGNLNLVLRNKKILDSLVY